MNSRAEVTTRYARAYVKAAKGDWAAVVISESRGIAQRRRRASRRVTTRRG